MKIIAPQSLQEQAKMISMQAEEYGEKAKELKKNECLEIAKQMYDLSNRLEKSGILEDSLNTLNFIDDIDIENAPKREVLKAFLAYHGPSYRSKINEESGLKKGTIDTLLRSEYFEVDDQKRWRYKENHNSTPKK